MPGTVASEDELGRKLTALSFIERRSLLEVLLSAHRDGGEGMTITALAAATETNRFTAHVSSQRFETPDSFAPAATAHAFCTVSISAAS